MDRYANLNTYLGNYPLDEVDARHSKWIAIARRMRERLGKQAHLVDEYLIRVFHALNSPLVSAAMVEGYRHADNLRRICKAIVYAEVTDDIRRSEHFPAIQQYIDTHPKSCAKETQTELYFAEFLTDFIPHAVTRYQHDAASDIYAEIAAPRLYQIAAAITKLLGSDELLEDLNTAIERRFQIVIPVEDFLQGVDNSLLESLLRKNRDSGKYAFQYLLEGEGS